MMKKIVLTFLLLASVISACAQYRHWEHNIYAGNGLIAEYKGEEGDPSEGTSFVLGYGLAYRFSLHWSVMPGVAWRVIGPLGESFDGVDDDAFWFVDIPLLGRYHTGVGKRNWIFGVGPALSFCVRNETFYVDADPRSPLNHLDKCKAFTLGLQPTASYQFARHFNVGLDCFICLTDQKLHHGMAPGSKYIHSFTVRMAFNF